MEERLAPRLSLISVFIFRGRRLRFDLLYTFLEFPLVEGENSKYKTALEFRRESV